MTKAPTVTYPAHFEYAGPTKAFGPGQDRTSVVHPSFSQQLFEPFAVESHNNFAVNDCNRGGQHAEFYQFVHSRFIIYDIAFHERNISLRKKLFRHLAKVSTVRLGIDKDFSHHRVSSYTVENGTAAFPMLLVVGAGRWPLILLCSIIEQISPPAVLQSTNPMERLLNAARSPLKA